MPHPEVERLENGSERAQVQAALSACVAREVSGGMEQQAAVAMCADLVQKRTGGGQQPRPPEERV